MAHAIGRHRARAIAGGGSLDLALVLSHFQWPGRGMVRVAPIQQGAVWGGGGVGEGRVCGSQCFKPSPAAPSWELKSGETLFSPRLPALAFFKAFIQKDPSVALLSKPGVR